MLRDHVLWFENSSLFKHGHSDSVFSYLRIYKFLVRTVLCGLTHIFMVLCVIFYVLDDDAYCCNYDQCCTDYYSVWGLWCKYSYHSQFLWLPYTLEIFIFKSYHTTQSHQNDVIQFPHS